MIQTYKEYQKDYFRSEGYKIFETLDNVIKLYCEIYQEVNENAKRKILDNTNCDWSVLNDGSVAAFPGVLLESGEYQKGDPRDTFRMERVTQRLI